VPAAVRLPRSAAARRALLTLLFLGGFLALAFLFGGSAQAVSGAEHPGKGDSGAAASGLLAQDEASQAESDAQERDAREARRAAARNVSQMVAPVAQGAERTGQQLARPVVQDTANGVAGAADLEGLAAQLGLSGDSGEGDGSGADDATGNGDGDSATGSADGSYGLGADGLRGSSDAVSASALSSDSAAANTTADDGTSRGNGGLPGQLPFHQTPAAPVSTTSQYAGDANGPRGGGVDKLAGQVTGVQGLAALQPGAVRAAHGTPTRDRAAEILEFPG
jgi:hypothetical protein